MSPAEAIADAARRTVDHGQREAYLNQACGADEDLRRRVDALLSVETVVSDRPAHRAAMEAPGDLIGPYKLRKAIGAGGMGAVYLAQQEHPIRREVALKIIRPGMDSERVVARFEAERQTLALMDHPNIAKVFDAGTTATGRPYFAMELVEGVPITGYCDRNRLNLHARLELLIPVCRAIQHAHQKGIIHRDIKPSNVLVSVYDGKPTPKVIDFGIAKAIYAGTQDSEPLTQFGAVIGTLEYMSPEQAETGVDVDTRSDIYSLGVLLYELLTGAMPLEFDVSGSSYIEILKRIREEEPPPPSVRLAKSIETLASVAAERGTDPARLGRKVRGELDWIVMKALEKDRNRRYETANGLARDIERYLGGEPLEASPPSATYRARKFARRHRVGIAAAGVFVGLLVGGILVSTWQAVRARRAEQVAQAVSAFLQDDLLSQASSEEQSNPNLKPDPDLKVRTALDRAAAQVGVKFKSQPAVEAAIRRTIGKTYSTLGLFRESQGQLERALELDQRVLGPEHPTTLETMNYLVEVTEYQGLYPQAEALGKKTLELRKRILGSEHSETVTSMHNLGMVYADQAKYTEASALLREAVELLRRTGQVAHPVAGSMMDNLGGIYFRMGNYREAEEFMKEGVNRNSRAVGSEHPNTLTARNNFALLQRRLGKFAIAAELDRQILASRQVVLKPEHPDTLASMGNLAADYLLLGRYPEAEDLGARTVAAFRRTIGVDHPNTLTFSYYLAIAYGYQGKYKEADALLNQVLEGQKRARGVEHPDALRTMGGMATLLLLQKRYAQAEDLYSRVLNAQKRVLGAEHPLTLGTVNSVAIARLSIGKHAEAEALLRENTPVFEKTLPDNWQRYNCQSLLGASLAGQQKYAEAERLLLTGYKEMLQRESTIPATDRYFLVRAKESIAQLHRALGKPSAE